MSLDPVLSTLISTWRLAADMAGRPDEFVVSVQRLGFAVDVTVDLAEVPAAAEIAAAMPVIEEHAVALSDGGSFEEFIAALEIVPLVADVVEAIETADLDDLTDVIDGVDIDVADFALRWPQMLLFDVIEDRAPWFVVLLELLGMARRHRYTFEIPIGDDDDPDVVEVERDSVTLDVGGLESLVADPAAHFAELLLNGDAIDHRLVADAIRRLLGSAITVNVEPASPSYVATYLGGARPDDGADVMTVGFRTPSAPWPLRNVELVIGTARPGNDASSPARALAIGAVDIDIDPSPIAVGDSASLIVETPDVSAGLIVDTDGSIEPVGTLIGDVAVTVDASPATPWRLVGGQTGPRLELAGAEVGATYSLDDGEFVLMFALRGLKFDMGAEGTDSFMAELVSGVSAELDPTLTLSQTGLVFDSNGSLSIRVPANLQLGPILLQAIEVGVGADAGALELAVTVDVEATIGPLLVSVSGVGLDATFRSGEDASDFGLDIGLRLPSGIAFSFEGSDVISGGGFIDIDADIGRYSGGISLTIFEVGISALTVIDTQLPEDPDGWAFFLSLGIDIPGIPLGFGFTLEGLGGLVALNRSVDGDALAAGLRAGAVDAILFPDDPVRDAAVLIPQIDEYFPLLSGNTVIGPVVEVGWGMPVTLIAGQVGVMVSLPQGLIVIMGSLSTALPTPDAAVLEINMDALGVIDLTAGTILATASLYDSRLLGTIELSGDMAFFLATTPSPYFALSVGGWHPSFQPPAVLPSVFTDLRRIRAEVSVASNVSITFESYFALTPNTVQFGGEFRAVATVRVALVDYRAEGWFGFDVLLVFNPFKLVAEASAGVAVYAGNKELMGVDLEAHVEGPEPWFASGHARFKFFGVNVKFDFTVGGTAAPEIPPVSDVLELIAEQLAVPDAWRAIAPTGVSSGVQLTSDDEALLLPDSRIEVTQSVAPLERTLEKFGTNLSAQARVSMTSARIVDGVTGDEIVASSENVDGWFAPAQFDEMSDRQRLAAPSYEEMTAGVGFGIDGVAVAEPVTVEAGHETKVWTEPIGRNVSFESIGTVTRAAGVLDGWYSPGPARCRRTGTMTATTPTFELAGVVYHEVAGQSLPVHVEVPG